MKGCNQKAAEVDPENSILILMRIRLALVTKIGRSFLVLRSFDAVNGLLTIQGSTQRPHIHESQPVEQPAKQP